MTQYQMDLGQNVVTAILAVTLIIIGLRTLKLERLVSAHERELETILAAHEQALGLFRPSNLLRLDQPPAEPNGRIQIGPFGVPQGRPSQMDNERS